MLAAVTVMLSMERPRPPGTTPIHSWRLDAASGWPNGLSLCPIRSMLPIAVSATDACSAAAAMVAVTAIRSKQEECDLSWVGLLGSFCCGRSLSPFAPRKQRSFHATFAERKATISADRASRNENQAGQAVSGVAVWGV